MRDAGRKKRADRPPLPTSVRSAPINRRVDGRLRGHDELKRGQARGAVGSLPLMLALCCALAAQCRAAEGFFADNPAARGAAPSGRPSMPSCAKARRGSYTATAFLVGKAEHARGKKRADYFFLTAGHAIEDCKGRRRYLVPTSTSRSTRRTASRVARPPAAARARGKVEVDDAYDIAVIKVERRRRSRRPARPSRSATSARTRCTRRSTPSASRA